MSKLLYYLILLPLSRLPLAALYVLSDGLYLLGYRLLGYRKKVVFANLRASFPERDEAWVRTTAAEFYHWFFDTIVESIRAFSMDEGAAVRRCKVINPEAVSHLIGAGRSVIVVGAHYGNWELAALSFPSQFPGATVMGIYSPPKNEALDRLLTDNRGRTGTELVSRRAVTEYFSRQATEPSIDFFIADQSPSNADWTRLHWTPFLHRTTSFLAGPERYAVRHDRPVYYMNLRRQRRGHFTGKLIKITEDPANEAPGYITECFVRILEHEIRRAPAYWLWTHRRWKRGVVPEAAAALAGRAYWPPRFER